MNGLRYVAWAVIGVRWLTLLALFIALAGKAKLVPLHVGQLKAVWLVWAVAAIMILEVTERLIATVLEVNRIATDPLPFLCGLPGPVGWVATIVTMASRLWGWHQVRTRRPRPRQLRRSPRRSPKKEEVTVDHVEYPLVDHSGTPHWSGILGAS